MSELADLAGVPDAARELWTKLVAEQLRPVHELFKEVKDYQQAIAQRSSMQDAEVDPTLARELVSTSLRLLGTLNDETPESTRRLIQAAVRYFIIEEDADSDLDSILGLDDDAEVMNAVLKVLGHDRWIVDIP
jgi:uncharacterized membrane protein YkvA (DUF1232 family)